MLFFFSVEFGLQALEGDLQQPARQAAALMDRLLLWQVSQDYHADDIMDPAVASSHTNVKIIANLRLASLSGCR